MKLAIMQPYFLPYIGYFQLMYAADKFVFYDDVNFIKQGWINRNNLLLNKNKYLFSLPVQNLSSNATIRETFVSERPINWEKGLLKTIEQAYRKAPFFVPVYSWVAEILRGAVGRSVADVAIESIEKTLDYIDVKVATTRSYNLYQNQHLTGTDRVIHICHQENATTYINAIGGQALYDKTHFKQAQIDLFFIKPNLQLYPQPTTDFVAGLSILDILMNTPPSVVKAMLEDYTLV